MSKSIISFPSGAQIVSDQVGLVQSDQEQQMQQIIGRKGADRNSILRKSNASLKKVLDKKRGSYDSSTRNVDKKITMMPQEPIDDNVKLGKMMSTVEAKLTREAVKDYTLKKSRYFKSKRIFDDELITTKSKGSISQKRTDLVKLLLGNSREAQSISGKFRKMVEVAQEDFSIDNYRILSQELRNKVTKPALIYKSQLKMNVKHIKKLTEIEDFVTILPTKDNQNDSKQSQQPWQNATGSDSMSNYDLSMISLNQDLPKQDDSSLLALMDDPSKQTLAIGFGSSVKQSAPLIATLESNLDQSMNAGAPRAAYDGSTFITNMQEQDEGGDDLLIQKPSGIPTTRVSTTIDHDASILPSISMKSRPQKSKNASHWATGTVRVKGYGISGESKDSRTGNKSKEYQLMPVIDSAPYESTDYSQASRFLVNKNDPRQTVDLKHQSLSILPRSRARLQREPSELSFSNGKRQAALDSRKSARRILGGRSGYSHSTLRSALGRESRVLQKLYQRVENFKKPEKEREDGSRVGFSQGLVEILGQKATVSVAKSAAFRKSLSKIKRGKNQRDQEGAQHKKMRTLNPMESEEDGPDDKFDFEQYPAQDLQGTVNIVTKNSTVMLPSQLDQTNNSQQLNDNAYIVSVNASHHDDQYNIVDKAVQGGNEPNHELGRNSVSLRGGVQYKTLNTSTDSRQMLPWDNSEPLETVARLSASINNRAIPLQPASTKDKTIAQNRSHNQSVLNQYKQKRLLVSNVQVTKLIRKDMKMFTGSTSKESNPRASATIPQSSKNKKNDYVNADNSTLKRRRNSMLDDDSEDITSPLNIPGLSQQLPVERSIETRYRDEEELKLEMVNTNTINNLAPHGGVIVAIVGESELDQNSFQLEVRTRGVSNEPDGEEKRGGRYAESGSPQLRAAVKQEKSGDRLLSQVEYYRSLGQAVRDSEVKLSQVVIRGKNIPVDNATLTGQSSGDNTPLGHKEHSPLLKQSVGSDPHNDVVIRYQNKSQAVLKTSLGSQNYLNKTPHSPISVHVDNAREGGNNNYRIETKESHDQKSASTSPLLQQASFKLPGHSRMRLNDASQLRSTESIVKGPVSIQVPADVGKVRSSTNILQQNEHQKGDIRGMKRKDSSRLQMLDPYAQQPTFNAINESQTRKEYSKADYRSNPNHSSKKHLNQQQDQLVQVQAHRVNINGPFVLKGGNKTKKTSQIDGQKLIGNKFANKQASNITQKHVPPFFVTNDRNLSKVQQHKNSKNHVDSEKHNLVVPREVYNTSQAGSQTLAYTQNSNSFVGQVNSNVKGPIRDTLIPANKKHVEMITVTNTMNQTKNTLMNNKSSIQFNEGSDEDASLMPISTAQRDLEPQYLPKIKIKMVLSAEVDNDAYSQQSVNRQEGDMFKTLDEKRDLVQTQGSQIVVTEGSFEPTLKAEDIAIQQQKQQQFRYNLKSRTQTNASWQSKSQESNKSNGARGFGEKVKGAQSSHENLDLASVIQTPNEVVEDNDRSSTTKKE